MIAKATESIVEGCRKVLRHWSGAGLSAVYLYGSTLGNRRRNDSDVDIAVLERSERRLSWSEQSRLMDELERALGQPVDLRMLRDCALSHQIHVFDEGKLLWAERGNEPTEYVHATKLKFEAERENVRKAGSLTLRKLAQRLAVNNESAISR